MINTKLKKAMAVTLVSAMAVSSLAACSSSSSSDAGATKGTEDTKAPDESKDESQGGGTEAGKMEAPSTEGWDESKKIWVYSWNDEFGSRLQVVLDKYPQFKDYYEYVNFGISGTDGQYIQKIDALLEKGAGAEYPSIIAMDDSIAKYYYETENTLSLDDLGITSDMYANAYKYTIDYATYNGKVKGLTWQATPGNFTYRASIAEKVLGTSEPDKVQEYVKDWETFFDTADKMKDAGYKMLSGADDIKYAIWDQKTTPWLTVDGDNEKLTLDDTVKDYLEKAKKLYDGDYTDKTTMWSDPWNANFEDDVFGYFGCTWFVYWSIKYAEVETGEKDEKGDPIKEPDPNGTYGDWRLCVGPESYHWGGSYMAVMKDCPNVELAAFLMYSLCCDEDIMYTIQKDSLDFVNNKAANKRISEDGSGKSGVLGGQDPVASWMEAAEKIDLSNSTYLDATIYTYIDKASEAYNAGTYATADEAIQYIKDQVKSNYDYITVE